MDSIEGDPPAAGSGLVRIEQDTLHDRVYREVKKAIMSGAIAPGTTITIRSLAVQLGTSPMPVREALRRLVAERALDMLPNRSVTLPAMSPSRFEEICRLRMAIEGMMAAVGAEHISDDDVARMRRLNEAMFQPEKRFTPEYLTLNREFHFTIYQAAGMPLAMAMIEPLWVQSGPYLNLVMTEIAEELGSEHHTMLLMALAGRDGTAARAAIEGDIRDAGAIILSLLRRTPARASI